jgi:thioredoxin-like negative regulator of GroEL
MGNVIEVDSDNWKETVLRSDILTVAYFWHNQCSWCIRLNPIFNEIAEKYEGRMRFVKLDILKTSGNQALASGYGVMGTPTFMFFCHGRSVGQAVGFMPREQLDELLADMLQRYRMCLMQSTELKPFYIV